MTDMSKQPGIICENIILEKMEFSRTFSYNSKPDMNVNMIADVIFSEDKKKLVYKLTAEITEKRETPLFNLICTVVGVFSISQEYENMSLEEYSKYNAPATIIPFLRENVANITMRSGLKPFILPPINIYLLVKENKTGNDVIDNTL